MIGTVSAKVGAPCRPRVNVSPEQSVSTRAGLNDPHPWVRLRPWGRIESKELPGIVEAHVPESVKKKQVSPSAPRWDGGAPGAASPPESCSAETPPNVIPHACAWARGPVRCRQKPRSRMRSQVIPWRGQGAAELVPSGNFASSCVRSANAFDRLARDSQGTRGEPREGTWDAAGLRLRHDVLGLDWRFRSSGRVVWGGTSRAFLVRSYAL